MEISASVRDPSPLLTEREAANFLRIGHSTLMRWRREGSGPKSIRLSARRLAYRISDLDNFLREREQRADA
jgi:predicted DNA-binding transcriptional regulator AlpA